MGIFLKAALFDCAPFLTPFFIFKAHTYSRNSVWLMPLDHMNRVSMLFSGGWISEADRENFASQLAWEPIISTEELPRLEVNRNIYWYA